MTDIPRKDRVVVVRPTFDVATRLISNWAEEAIAQLTLTGKTVYDLLGPNATSINLRQIIEDFNPHSILIFTHGDECCVYGQEGTVASGLLGMFNAEITKGRAVGRSVSLLQRCTVRSVLCKPA